MCEVPFCASALVGFVCMCLCVHASMFDLVHAVCRGCAHTSFCMNGKHPEVLGC